MPRPYRPSKEPPAPKALTSWEPSSLIPKKQPKAKPTATTAQNFSNPEVMAHANAVRTRRRDARTSQDLKDVGDYLASAPDATIKDAARAVGVSEKRIQERADEAGHVIGGSAIPVYLERFRQVSDIGLEKRRAMLATAMNKWEDIMEGVHTPKDLQSMVTSLGVLIDKSRLETGEVTERIEQLSRFENRHHLELEARARLVEMFPEVAAELPPPIDPVEDEHRETLRRMREEQEALARVGVVDRSLWEGLTALNK